VAAQDPKPELPPLRGLSVATGKAIISTINAFLISRRFQDELAEKRRADVALRRQSP